VRADDILNGLAVCGTTLSSQNRQRRLRRWLLLLLLLSLLLLLLLQLATTDLLRTRPSSRAQA